MMKKLVFMKKQMISTSKGHIEHCSLVKIHNTIFGTKFVFLDDKNRNVDVIGSRYRERKLKNISGLSNQDIGCRKVKAKKQFFLFFFKHWSS